MKKIVLAAALAVLSLGAAQAAPSGVAEVRYGGWNNYGPGGNYYMQQYPGPNCYSYPHPVYGWICY
jgi:hypothetical protein